MSARRPAWVIWVRPDPCAEARADGPTPGAPWANVLGGLRGVRVVPSPEIGASVTEELREGVVDAARDPAVVPALSVLFVWDGEGAVEGFLGRCMKETERVAARFREALDRLAQGATNPVANSRFEVLLRLPLTPAQAGSAEGQGRWLEDLDTLFTPPGGGRAGISRVWLLGSHNIDTQAHPDGVMVRDQAEAGRLLGEVLHLWVHGDLGGIIDSGALPGQWFASVGVARLACDGAAAAEARAASFAAQALSQSLEGGPSSDADGPIRFLTQHAFLENMTGLGGDEVLRTLVNRRNDVLSDLRMRVSLALESKAIDAAFESPEAFRNVPAQVMTQGNLVIARELFRAAMEVGAVRDQLLLSVAREFDARIGKDLSGARPYLAQIEESLRAWRTWIEARQQEVRATVDGALGIDGYAAPGSFFRRILGLVRDPRDLVPEQDPSPQEYCDKLSEQLVHRPWEEAWLARSALGALLLGQTAGVLAGDIGPFVPWVLNVPGLGVPWLVAPAVTAVFLGFSVFRLHRRALKRRQALAALRMAIVRHGQALLRAMLVDQMECLYGDVLELLGHPKQAAPAAEAVEIDLARRLQTIGDLDEPTAALLRSTLFSRLGVLRAQVQHAVDAERARAAAAAAEESPWVRVLPGPEALQRFPFLEGNPEQIDIAAGATPEATFPRMARELGMLAQAWGMGGQAAGTLAETTRQWCRREGFTYLERAPIWRILDFLVRLDPGWKSQWISFLRRAAWPYFALPAAAHHRLHVASPPAEPGERGMVDEVTREWPRQAFAGWRGGQGLLVAEIAGPVARDALPILPLDYETARDQASGSERAFEV